MKLYVDLGHINVKDSEGNYRTFETPAEKAELLKCLQTNPDGTVFAYREEDLEAQTKRLLEQNSQFLSPPFNLVFELLCPVFEIEFTGAENELFNVNSKPYPKAITVPISRCLVKSASFDYLNHPKIKQGVIDLGRVAWPLRAPLQPAGRVEAQKVQDRSAPAEVAASNESASTGTDSRRIATIDSNESASPGIDSPIAAIDSEVIANLRAEGSGSASVTNPSPGSPREAIKRSPPTVYKITPASIVGAVGFAGCTLAVYIFKYNPLFLFAPLAVYGASQGANRLFQRYKRTGKNEAVPPAPDRSSDRLVSELDQKLAEPSAFLTDETLQKNSRVLNYAQIISATQRMPESTSPEQDLGSSIESELSINKIHQRVA